MNLWSRLFGKRKCDAEPSGKTPEHRSSPPSADASPAVDRAAQRPAPGAREIRVFISSTFRDMMQERDLLVKEVFPDLRRTCARRFVTFTEVDLRWGINKEQAAEGQVLPLCLAEIERSRPYFIGLLGERYGWIPDEVRPEVIEREPWLREHVQGRTSVTELEILHGVLNDPEMETHAFFYFRDPTYANSPALSEDELRDMVERNIPIDVEKHGEAEATRRTEERRARLAALKQRIRKSGLPLVETYADPRELAEIVRQQFDELIDRLFPEEQTPDPLAQERILHEAHAMGKLFACIDRPAHLKALSDYAAHFDHDGKGFVLTGESGCGKTALLAAWARDYAKAHPDDFLFQHYFGATPDSAPPEGFLRRLMGELKVRFEITEDIPSDPAEMRETLPVWLAQGIGKGRIVLVLDGLNQVQGDEPDRRLRFLPRYYPPNAIVLASALPGPALDTLRELGWTEHDLPLAEEGEVDEMVGKYLSIYARTLDPALRCRLVTTAGSKNPLFLRTVLEELRQFGSFERLPERVAHYLEASDLKELFLRVLQRWADDFDGNRALVVRALSYVWASRNGLAEAEWLELLADEHGPMDRQTWRPLFLALESHLVQRTGRYSFGHDFMRQAVEAKCLGDESAQRTAHLALARYFGDQPTSTRRVEELPWQLRHLEQWQRMRDVLVDPAVLITMMGNDRLRWDLNEYWILLESRYAPFVEYRGSAAEYASKHSELDTATFQHLLGEFFIQREESAFAVEFLESSYNTRVTHLGRQDPEVLASGDRLALALEHLGELTRAEELYQRLLGISEQEWGSDHSHTLQTVYDLGGFYFAKGDCDRAIPLLERAFAGRNRDLGASASATLATQLTLGLAYGLAKDPRAEAFLTDLLEATERATGRDSVAAQEALVGLGAFYAAEKKDPAAAEPLLWRAVAIAEANLGPLHMKTIRNLLNYGNSLVEQGKTKEGLKHWLEAYHRTGRSSGNMLLLQVSLMRANILRLLIEADDYRQAAPLIIDDLDEISRLMEHKDDRALLYVQSNRPVGPDPEDCFQRAFHVGYQLMNDDIAMAERILLTCLSVAEPMFGDKGLFINVACNGLGIIEKRREAFGEAERYFRRSFAAAHNLPDLEEARDAAHRNLLWVQRRRLEQQIPTAPKQGVLELVRKLEAHAGPVFGLSYSMESQHVLSGGQDALLRLWKGEPLALVHTFAGHEGPITAVAFGHGGRVGVSGSWDRTVRQWNLAGQSPLPFRQDCPADVCGVASNTEGTARIVFALENGLVAVWDTPFADGAKVLGRHGDAVMTAAISHDGQLAISGSIDQSVSVWDLVTGRSMALLGHRSSVLATGIGHDRKLGLSGGKDNVLLVWDMEGYEMLQMLVGHEADVSAVAISGDARWIASGSWDNTVRIWNTATGARVASYDIGEQVWSMAATPSFDAIYVGDRAGTISQLRFVANADSL